MDLLKAVEYESLENIKQLLSAEIPQNLEWLDYELLVKAFERGKIDVVEFLLEKNCRVNKTIDLEQSSSTPLHYAVKLENSKLVSDLLLKGASINSVDLNGNTPLHLAFIRRSDKMIEILIESIKKNSNYENKRNNDGLTHLHIVSSRQNTSIIIKEYAMKGIDIGEKVSDSAPMWKGFTALHFAVKFHSLSSIKTLVELDENLICAIDFNEKTALELADNLRKKYHKISHFIKSNNKPASNQSFGYTPLHLAFYRETPEDIISDVELLYASLKKKIEECKTFDDNEDENGLSYMHIAMSRGDHILVNKYLKPRREDLNSEVRLNSRAFSNFGSLHFAVKYSQKETTEWLIKRGVDVNKVSADGTALHIACELGNCWMIELLLKNDADVNAVRPSDGKTPLQVLVWFFAATCKSNDVKTNDWLMRKIEELIVDVNVEDKFRRSALYQNSKGLFIDGFGQCIKLLIAKGADINLGGNFEIEANETLQTENCRIFCEHVLNLLELGLTISQKNEEICKKILKKMELGNVADRQFEVKKMKELKLNNQLTLYDFMHLEPRRAKLHKNNEKLLNIIKDAKLESEYPIYAYLIRVHYIKAVKYMMNLVGSVVTADVLA